MNVGKRHDATGRSTGRQRHFGPSKKWKFEEGFVGLTKSLLESPAYRALNLPALKILTALQIEHLTHGGMENGRLLAPYRQLQANWRISPKNIKVAISLLEALGIIRCTSNGQRLGGRPNAATYALTWLPTADGELPTMDFERVSKAQAQAITEARRTARKPTESANDDEPKNTTQHTQGKAA